MFEFAIGFMIYSLWFALLCGPVTLFVMRLIYIIKKGLRGSVALSILLLPCSLGFYYYHPQSSGFKLAYKIVSAVFFASAVIGSLFLIYMIK